MNTDLGLILPIHLRALERGRAYGSLSCGLELRIGVNVRSPGLPNLGDKIGNALEYKKSQIPKCGGKERKKCKAKTEKGKRRCPCDRKTSIQITRIQVGLCSDFILDIYFHEIGSAKLFKLVVIITY
jgi:hypothetical protein